MPLYNTIEKLQAAARKQPFESFAVTLPSGKKVLIDDPAALIFRGDSAVYLDRAGGCLVWSGDSVRLVPAIRRLPRQPPSLWLIALVVVQLLGICGAVIAATIEIETIVGSGPIFSLLGLIIAANGVYTHVRRVAWWGASALVMSLFVFALILIAEWNPADARHPVGIILLLYQAAAVPLGLSALWQLLLPKDDARRAWQFDLKSLLGFTSLLAVILAASRIANRQGLNVLAALAIGGLAGTLAALYYLGYSVWRQTELRLPQRLGLAAISISPPDEPRLTAP